MSEARRYVSASQSQPGTLHAMLRTAADWVCTCDDFMLTGCCKHLGAVERRAEREGWDFGAVCPLHRAAKYFPVDADAERPASATPISFPPVADRQQRDAELYGRGSGRQDACPRIAHPVHRSSDKPRPAQWSTYDFRRARCLPETSDRQHAHPTATYPNRWASSRTDKMTTRRSNPHDRCHPRHLPLRRDDRLV